MRDTVQKYTMTYILYILHFYTVQVMRISLDISSSKLNISSIFIGCSNLQVFWTNYVIFYIWKDPRISRNCCTL